MLNEFTPRTRYSSQNSEATLLFNNPKLKAFITATLGLPLSSKHYISPLTSLSPCLSQVVPKSQHHHWAHTPVQHEVHAVQSEGLLLTRSLQTGEGEPCLDAFLVRRLDVCLWITEFQSHSERPELEITGLVVYSHHLLSIVTLNAMVNMSENSNVNTCVNEQNNNLAI